MARGAGSPGRPWISSIAPDADRSGFGPLPSGYGDPMAGGTPPMSFPAAQPDQEVHDGTTSTPTRPPDPRVLRDMSRPGGRGVGVTIAPPTRTPSDGLSSSDDVPDLGGLEQALRERVDGDVDFGSGARAMYATDASNYRQVPYGVVVPRTIEAAAAAVHACAEAGVPIVSRGGGTSLAGQATNQAVVIDFSKYCNRLVSVDPESRTCIVEPGIVLDDLNGQLAAHGLRFGPEPATHPNCTIGGMVGNNSCGATAQRTGKVSENIVALEALLPDGARFWCGPTSDEQYRAIERHADRRATIYRTLRRIRDEQADRIRDGYPDIPRRVSGYNLDALLPEGGFDLARLLVGSEGTLAVVLRAELALVPVVPARSMVVLGYPDIAEAADAVPAVLSHEPIALEGVDRHLIHDEQLKNMNADALHRLPSGAGFLLVQFGGEDTDEANARARGLLDELEGAEGGPSAAFVDDPDREAELWSVREAGLAATARVPRHRDTWPGWEDSAVAPERLGDYLRDLRDLFEEFGFATDAGPSLYGHFGQGCVHTRIPFDLTRAEGVAQYRRFLEQAARLVASYGGSLSGEHGDGQARGELLPVMFGDELVAAMEEVKHAFDPRNLMNPGKVVDPRPLDADLRFGRDWAPAGDTRLHFAFPDDDGSFTRAVSRCVGVGKCRRSDHSDGSVMCPSYQVTRNEQHATRGRARLLFEMLDGNGDSPVDKGWRSPEVRDALDLCLGCKGCKSDCPAGVDMATYKAEFLAQHYRGRIRPRADYALGWLPLAAQAVTRGRLSRVVNAAARRPALHRLATRAAGLEPRSIPPFAPRTLQQWWSHRRPHEGHRGTVLLWPDTFTNHFDPEVGQAAIRVLEDAGWTVDLPTEPLCCGLTWISTGQLGIAERVLRRTVSRLSQHVRAGGLVVGLEPSCTTVFRSDASELRPHDPDVARLRDHTVTFAELLTEHTPGWEPRRQDDGASPRAVAQVHCHQHAVLGWDADRELLERVGVETDKLASGCCGLAGNFGFTAGHLDVSVACAEQELLPRLRAEEPETAVLADGFSCRTQIRELHDGPHQPRHLAQLLDPATDHARRKEH